ARYDYMIESASVRMALRSAYISLLKSQEMIEIAREIEKRRLHNLELVRMRYASGNEHKGAYLAAKADFSKAQADSASARRSAASAGVTLCGIMGITLRDITASGAIADTESNDTDPPFELLVRSHPAVKKMEYSRTAASLAEKSAMMEFSPKIYATAGAERIGMSLPASEKNYSVGVEVSAPLFQGGQTYYSAQKAKSACRQSGSDVKSAEASVRTGLETSWNNLKDSIDNLSVQKEYLYAAEERSKIAEAQYAIGRLTFDNWTLIEDALVQAKKSCLDARVSLQTAKAQWIESTGGTIEDEK
ncbi:MAG: TolC family protein, partial [Spirochaetota bacterium]